jgi:hypothetical protein
MQSSMSGNLNQYKLSLELTMNIIPVGVKQYLKNIFMARKRLKSRQILPKTSLVLEYNIEHNLIFYLQQKHQLFHEDEYIVLHSSSFEKLLSADIILIESLLREFTDQLVSFFL